MLPQEDFDICISVELSGATLNPSTHISEQIVVHYDPAEVIHTSLAGTSLSVPRVSSYVINSTLACLYLIIVCKY